MNYCNLWHRRQVVRLISCMILIAASFKNYKKYINWEYASTWRLDWWGEAGHRRTTLSWGSHPRWRASNGPSARPKSDPADKPHENKLFCGTERPRCSWGRDGPPCLPASFLTSTAHVQWYAENVTFASTHFLAHVWTVHCATLYANIYTR